MLKIRKRSCLFIIAFIVITPCIVLLMILGPELSTEQALSQRLGECHMRLQYLASMYRIRQEDVSILSQYLGQQLLANSTPLLAANAVLTTAASSWNNGSGVAVENGAAKLGNLLQALSPEAKLGNLLQSLSPEARQLLKNATHNQQPGMSQRLTASNIRLPNAYHFLPHLLDDPNSLRPSYLQSKGRSDVSIVLGIPTVKREKQSYLLGTLKNLLDRMNEEEQNQTLIIVFIGETDADSVQQIAREIELSFEQQIESGLIDIIAPSPSYYPNLDRLQITLNDSMERIKWRSKQNLDFAYLMAYAQARGTFYVQLEDDILAKKNYITSMKKFAIAKSALLKADQPSWFVLDFCQLGFIGKMFKSAELPHLINFFQMFYNDKPVDWLLYNFLETKVCRSDKDAKHCHTEKGKYWIHYKPSLFQHIGTSSSLKGKVQKLKDKGFGSKIPAYYAHADNPAANVKTNIAAYRNFNLKRAYKGESYFWGLLPQPGDTVQFIFEKPQHLKRYLFRSGNSEHPSDRFYNTSVEIKPLEGPSENASLWSNYNTTADGFVVLGGFDNLGLATGELDLKIGPIKEVRLSVHGDSENWSLLSEIHLQTVEAAAIEEEKRQNGQTANSEFVGS